MKALAETTYRIALSEGFLTEAQQDLGLKRWRSCVDNAQLAVENAGKAVLSLYNVSPKTHEPAQQVAALLREEALPDTAREIMLRMLPDLLALGKREHFLTDYGDETTYTLPWDLFTQQSAEEALTAAQRSLEMAKELFALVKTSWNTQSEESGAENK